MANVVERTNGISGEYRTRRKPGNDRFAIRVGGLKALSGDDVAVGSLTIGQQQTALVEKLCTQAGQQFGERTNIMHAQPDDESEEWTSSAHRSVFEVSTVEERSTSQCAMLPGGRQFCDHSTSRR